MRAGLSLVTPPTVEPISLDQAKAFLRVETSADDALIEEQIRAAREFVEGDEVAMLTQTWDQQLDGFPYPNGPLELLRWPVQSIVSIKYVDNQGGLSTLAPTAYVSNLKTKPPRIAPTFGQYWPILALQPLANVTIQFIAGHLDPSACPSRLKQGIYMVLAHWYENREASVVGTISSELALALEEIKRPYRPPLFA